MDNTKNMELTFIGRGGAFAPMNIGQSNMFFEKNGKRLMLDCGTTAPYILRDEMGIDLTAKEWDGIYISHMHVADMGDSGVVDIDGHHFRPLLGIEMPHPPVDRADRDIR